MGKPVDIGADLSPRFSTGSKAVGVAAIQLFPVPFKVLKGVQLKADTTNTGIIYVGSNSGVTAAAADETDGFPISAGEGVFIATEDISKIYVIASLAAQEIYWLAK